tara:strand:- start:7775 stop:8611 length:837 start_codon:yes stop_codon:yes gene_type:complete
MGLFNLSIDPGNILNLFILVGPLFISTFYILYSCFEGTLAGIYWLVGVLFSQYFIGLLFRAWWASRSNKKTDKNFRKLMKEGKDAQTAYNIMRTDKKYFASSKRKWWTKKNSSGKGANFRDMCSLFIQPYSNTLYNTFSMPSLNSIFYSFTWVYLLFQGMFEGSSFDLRGDVNIPVVVSIILLGAFMMIDAMKQMSKGCNTAMDITVGTLIGSAIGFGWWALAAFALNPTMYGDKGGSLFFFDKKSRVKVCSVDSKKRFKCFYDDNSGKEAEDDDPPQ